MRKLITSIVFVFLVLGNLSAQQKRIYLAPDDHTDYMWTATEEEYRKAFLEMLDYYIDLNEKTASNPYHSQSKWNCDGSFWVYTYENNTFCSFVGRSAKRYVLCIVFTLIQGKYFF